MGYIALVLGILLVFLGFAAFSRLRYRALGEKRRRQGHDFERFQSVLAKDVPDEALLRLVYSHFTETVVPPIPVLPDDDIEKVYGIVGEDITLELEELAAKYRVPEPQGEQLAEVETIADAARLLYSLAQESKGSIS